MTPERLYSPKRVLDILIDASEGECAGAHYSGNRHDRKRNAWWLRRMFSDEVKVAIDQMVMGNENAAEAIFLSIIERIPLRRDDYIKGTIRAIFDRPWPPPTLEDHGRSFVDATSSAMRALGLLGRIVSGDSIEITHTITIS